MKTVEESNHLFSDYAVPPQLFTLSSGKSVEVAKCYLEFPRWNGLPISDTYGGKAVMESDGEAVFAEIGILRLLQRKGFDGVWVDTFLGRLRQSIAPLTRDLPADIREVYRRIVDLNKGRQGCWDILAWKGDKIVFVECKRKNEDRIRITQTGWLEASLAAGIALDCFMVCEWDIR
ncbi:MAG: hypothetical protein QOD84_1049 [Acidobacteriaceae bacterium]|jgi:hypothetical protein